MRIVSWFEENRYNGEETGYVWAYVENKGRGCWYGIDDACFKNVEQGDEDLALLQLIERDGFDPATLPHIEDQDKAVQRLWHDISESENCMWFVDKAEYTGGDDPDWVLCGFSQEEYERQIDDAIKKYRLKDVIAKNEDEGVLYTCYGNFQSAFSEEYVA